MAMSSQADSSHAASVPSGLLVVGIGASAGGLESLKTFLAEIPADSGLAIVLLRHIGDGARQLLVDALAPLTAIPVLPLASGMAPEPNRLYVVPPDSTITVEDGRFHLHRAPNAPQRGPIDRLFQVLAHRFGARAVGIVLSGEGSDGALGLKAINDAGGMTMAQDPRTAAHDEMPESAVSLGFADHVLPPAELARTLLAYARHRSAATQGLDTEQKRRELLARLPEICDVLRQRTSHDFKHYKTSTLLRRLMRRMQVLRVDTADAYVAHLAEDAQEPHVLFRELLIGVTAFFRDPDAFAALAKIAIAPLLKDRSSANQLRIWVPGCATGEEAYSIAMLVREQMDRLESPPQVQIFATDINERALAVARRGNYPQGIAAQISPERLARFFAKRGRRYQVSKELREMCLFSLHNVISDPPFSRLDMISCRNLLIYLGSHLQRKLIPVFHYALRSNGYLFLGASESLAGHGELFHTIEAKYRIAQRKDTRFRAPGQLRDFGGAGLPGWRDSAGSSEADIGAIAQRILLDEFAPKYAIAAEDGQVLYLSEGMDEFIQPPAGNFSNSITRMARRGLSVGLRTTFNEAVRVKRTVTRDISAVHTAGGAKAIRLTVQPMPDVGHEAGLYMVVFQVLGVLRRREREDGSTEPDADALIDQLERELQRTREELERTVQDLEAANEELKSSNEELLSMNEELQSSNEELETSKEEVQAANRALAAANADLENLLRSTSIATIFLDRDGKIRSFTPETAELYHLERSDIGRPLQHFTHRFIDLPPLPEPGAEPGGPIEHIARMEDGRVFLRRVLPYRGAEERIDGLVITFVDVTHLKEAEAALRESEARFRTLADSVPALVWMCGLDGTCTYLNRPWLDFTGDPLEAQLGSGWLAYVHPDDRAALDAFNAAVTGQRPFRAEFRLRRHDGVWRWMLSSGVPRSNAEGQFLGLIGSCVDITELKQAEHAAQRLAAIVESSADAIISKDLNGIIATWNQGAEHLFGYTAEEAIGKPILILIPSDRHDEEPEILARIRRGERVDHFETVRRRKDGSLVDVSLTVSPVKNAEGQVIGASKIARDITERKQAEERLVLLAREVDHRAKNMLAIVQATIRLTRARTVPEFVDIVMGRISAIARAHTLLAESRWAGADLTRLVAEELAPFHAKEAARVRLSGPAVSLDPGAAQAVAMALHELATNAAKYGALSVSGGRITVEWTETSAGRVVLRWVETGGPPVQPQRRHGFGMRVIERTVEQQLGGDVRFEWRHEGLVCELHLPSETLRAQPELNLSAVRPQGASRGLQR